MTQGQGDKLGPYEIVSPIGAGGMGEVYRARDVNAGSRAQGAACAGCCCAARATSSPQLFAEGSQPAIA